MNLNILTYCIYSALTFFIILRVGWLFYHYGAVYLYEIFGKGNKTADSLNRLLLLGYYLLNLGYVAFSINYWPGIVSYQQMIDLLSQRIGMICLVLALIHFANMSWVYLFKKQIQKLNN